VIALPPLLLGAVHLTCAAEEPAVAVTPVGAPGTLAAVGVTELDGEDSGPLPAELIALTVNTYD
jgi:hypothetical protein